VSTNQVDGAAAVQVIVPTSGVSEKKFYRAMTVQ